MHGKTRTDHDHSGGGQWLDRGWRYDVEVWFFDTFGLRGEVSRLRRRVVDLAQVGPGRHLLDVGCGTGTLAILASKVTGAAVSGLDPAPRQIEWARKKARGLRRRIDFRQGTIESIPFDDESLDAVTSTLMMHHLPIDLQARGLAELARVLKPGGRIVIADFSHSNKGHDAPDLIGLVGAAGFADIETEHVEFRKAAHGWSAATITHATKR